MKKLLLMLGLFVTAGVIAQSVTGDEWKKNYRATATKINDLVHTRLDARFDYNKSYLNGKVWLTLKPHFYATDSLQLDAKGMNINKVALVKATGGSIPLKYSYDSLLLKIKLNKTYQRDERYTLLIDYTAKPNEFSAEGSAAITDAKGLYFINPKGEDKDKPTQIWTQGETEATSVWVPTIDKPNQKSTQQFNLTVPAKYVTLSNGLLTTQTKNADGTRTDRWVMDKPHATYLFFIGVGDYAIVKDSYKGKEVSYYVEKAYEKVARKIFGHTPEMMKFFSEKLGIDYPWAKYSQIVGRDYVSGAMENTTATLHQESAQQDVRELVDGNEWESTIAHELFHQWFGDLVTAESWSNLTVNESFADYSQLLWLEYKYGKEEAAFENFKEMQEYLRSGDQNKDLVRFHYRDKEDMFDRVSYHKGGRILHMLRNYVGDDAFFASLNKYLTNNKFGNGSAHKLRLAFEEVTGKDLNWFFNQWYFGNGNPSLDISYGYDAAAQTAKVIIKQTQQGDKIFTLPLAIDVYNGTVKTRHNVWVENKTDSFLFKVPSKPDLINVDADKIILADKKDNKGLAAYIFQYKHGSNYLDRREAVDFASRNIKDPAAYQLVTDALSDPFHKIRAKALSSFGTATLDVTTLGKIEAIAKNDPYRKVRADAIDELAKRKDSTYRDFFLKAIHDSSYSVAGAALEALAAIDCATAFKEAGRLSAELTKGRLLTSLSSVLIICGDESVFDIVAAKFEAMPVSQQKFSYLATFSEFMVKVKDPGKFRKGIDLIIAFRDAIPQQARSQTDPYINEMILGSVAKKKETAGEKALSDYIKSKLPAKR
jgi:aminopeptidase N